MNRPARITVFAVLLSGLMLSMSGCNKLKARDQLNKGVDSYKAGKYEEAIGHFQKATELDPTLPMAKSYLATAISQNVVPGLDTPANLKTAQQAIGIFEQVLAREPNDINSLKQIAGIYFSVKRLDDAKEWQKKVLAVDPKDPEAAYTIGVIDWTEADENVLKELQSVGLNDDGEGNLKAPKKIMAKIKEENTALVDEARQYLNQALANRPNYDAAMAYMNLVYRRKADLDYEDSAAVKDDLAQAEDWRTKAMGARKENEEKKLKSAAGGVTMPSSSE
ncbi:MAG TPA: tetratricopeptide repeat protein [Terracidiphilus sp.]|nr:tetratricopeptide repeat protein [Terracidiphilus sp.]